MNNTAFGAQGNSYGFLFRFREVFRRLFKKKLAEPFFESGEESKWETAYRDSSKISFSEIFANRLTNYTLASSNAMCDDPVMDEALQRAVSKWYKWTQMAYGLGRVYLIPYVIGDRIYTDIVPQSRAWVTRTIGDDIVGIGVLADVRFKGNEMYTRLTSYEWNQETREFIIENKAIRRGGAEISLDSVEEWQGIEPFVSIKNVDAPLFAFVDCPKDNRSTDRLQGAPITYGCEDAIKEIMDCFAQYEREYNLKDSWLGVDRAMFDKNGNPDRSGLYKTFIGKSTENLFEIFSPDIRDQSYKNRILDLFARLEKQVGTSTGILTPSETANATATQVRRSMYDTFAIVNRMRASIDAALDKLAQIYGVYFELLGVAFEREYTITIEWSDDMVTDRAEQFSELMQANSAGAVKEEEIRRFVFPNETIEEAEAAIQEIKERTPEPQIPEFFGG